MPFNHRNYKSIDKSTGTIQDLLKKIIFPPKMKKLSFKVFWNLFLTTSCKTNEAHYLLDQITTTTEVCEKMALVSTTHCVEVSWSMNCSRFQIVKPSLSTNQNSLNILQKHSRLFSQQRGVSWITRSFTRSAPLGLS